MDYILMIIILSVASIVLVFALSIITNRLDTILIEMHLDNLREEYNFLKEK